MKYEADYKKLHKEGLFVGLTVMKYKDALKGIFAMHNVKTALDYGCGKAWAYYNEHLDETLKAKFDLYDPGFEQHSTLGDGPYDAVISVDVVEHVPEEEIDQVLENIFSRATKTVVLTFCARPARKTLPISKVNAHVLQKDRQWWEERIKAAQDRLGKKLPVFLFETE